MKICMLTSSHYFYDNRIYYKEILSLKNIYDEIYIIGPGEKDFVTEDGIIVKTFKKRRAWYDRIRPMNDMFNIAIKINADIYHAHEPDSFQVALRLKNTLKSKAIYDSHEYHPEAFSEHFKIGKAVIQKVIYEYEKRMAKNADYIITVNKILVNKFKKYNKNVALVPNYPVIYNRSLHKEYNEKPVFIYVGGIREDRGILKILEAIKLVRSDCQYLFVGSFENDEFKKKVDDFIKNNLINKDIVFTGQIPHLEVFNYLNKSCVGFVLLQPENWRYVNSEPIKLFEYMMTKTAVIASKFPMMQEIVENCKCGLAVEPDNIEEIASAIEMMSIGIENTKRFGENGYAAVKEMYNWESCEKIILDVYDSLLQ